jgi:hypothetical protein
MNVIAKQICSSALALFYGAWFAPAAQAYAFNMIVPDVRQPAAVSGGSACPVKARQLTSAGSIAIQWSTALNANPVTIVTQNQTAIGRLTEIEQVITQSMAVWAAVSGTTLVPATFAPLARTAAQNACGSDGLNTICFDQADMAFTPGVVDCRWAAARWQPNWAKFWTRTFTSTQATRGRPMRHRKRWLRLQWPTTSNRC